MKTAVLFFLKLTALVCILTLQPAVLSAQEHMFVHTATLANISGAATYIDHPELNNNPNAMLVATHNWNPPGNNSGIYLNNPIGVYYSNTVNKWSVFNENQAFMTVNAAFNVYIRQGNEMHKHVVTGNSYITELNRSGLNERPGAIPVISSYYNENSVYNNQNHGIYYASATDRWRIYNEDTTTDVPTDAAFFVLRNGEGTQAFRHQATPANISSNWTVIDHPLLNGNPDAICVVTHYWDSSAANVLLDKPIGVWYTGSNWAVYTEDLSSMPVNTMFNIIVYDPFYEPYCGPVVFTAASGVEPITVVQTAGFDNFSIPEINSTPGHENFTHIIGSMTAGKAYPIKLQGNTAGNFTNRFVVFIDWNQNGVLDDAGEVYEINETITNSTGTDGMQANGVIQVPANALSGPTRMRVKKIWSNTNFLNPCSGTEYGQLEDYTIVVHRAVESVSCGGDPEELSSLFASNNGFAGNMFDITASGGHDVVIESFDINLSGVGETALVSVYFRPGSYVGHEETHNGWSLLGTEVVTSHGDNNPTPLPVGGLEIPEGETYGIYITSSTNYPSVSMRYTDGSDIISDDYIDISMGVGKGTPDFYSGTFANRLWNGTVYYTSCSLGIVENEIDGFRFFPNPVRDILHLRADVSINQVALYNLLGQEVMKQTIDTMEPQINVAGLASGVYMLKVNATGQEGTYKIIKK